MRQWKLEAPTRPFNRAQEGDENGSIPMTIAAKLRDTETTAAGGVLAGPLNRGLKTCKLRQEMVLAQ